HTPLGQIAIGVARLDSAVRCARARIALAVVCSVMFTADARSRLLASLVERARSDTRIGAAALVGSLAAGTADAFSDIDLSFGVAGAARLEDVVEDWTRHLVEHEGAVTLFDLEARGTLYRVFLREDCLQIDLSFTPG